jgi:hypothetical protein
LPGCVACPAFLAPATSRPAQRKPKKRGVPDGISRTLDVPVLLMFLLTGYPVAFALGATAVLFTLIGSDLLPTLGLLEFCPGTRCSGLPG